MLTEKRQQEVIQLCRKLVQIKSYSGEEGKVAAELKSFFKSHGFELALGLKTI